jgi:molybdopterin/thiamine biosynthesis adenylyltransferase/rhodanese-related sulfurtransferase
MKTYRDLVAEAKQVVPEVSVQDISRRLAEGSAPTLVDVRDPDEYREGAIAGAVPISRGFLEFKAPEAFPDLDTPLVTYCLSGLRSLLAGKVLHDLGYRNVASMAGGVRRWKELGLPLVKDEPLTPEQMERYSRHFMLTQVGEPGQKQLLRSKVLLVGAGGLGSPTALYLAAAGVGTLGIIDADVVDLSNLQRQVLHRTEDVGRPKVESARDTIHALNPDVTVVPYQERISVDNIERIIKDYDVVVDGSDNFATRYLVNDACYLGGRTHVHGAIFQFEGMVTVLAPQRGPCYRCLYPEPPPAGLVPSCAEAGVLGVLPGLVGVVQATETVKLLLGKGEPLIGRLLTYDALGMRFREVKLRRDPRCALCGEHPTIHDLSMHPLTDEYCAVAPPAGTASSTGA